MNKTEIFLKKIEETFKESIAVMQDKNDDYAVKTNPFKNFELNEFSDIMTAERTIITRINEKFTRLISMVKLYRDNEKLLIKIQSDCIDAIVYLAILSTMMDQRKSILKVESRKDLVNNMEKIYNKQVEISKAKNKEYSSINPFVTFEINEYLDIVSTELAILSRTGDKIIRVANGLNKGGKMSVKDESLETTIVETIGFFAMLKIFCEMKLNR